MSQLIVNERSIVETIADLVDRVDPTNNLSGGIALDKTAFITLGGSAVGDGQGGIYVYRTSGRPASESAVVKFGPGASDYFELITQESTQPPATVTTETYQASSNGEVLFADSSSNDVTILLPVPVLGTRLTVTKEDASNTITLSGNVSAVTNSDSPEVASSWSANANTAVADLEITDHLGNISRNGIQFSRVGTDSSGSSFFILSSEAAVSYPITADVWIYRDAAAPHANSVTLSLFGTTHTVTSAEILNDSTATIAVASGLVNVDSIPDGYTHVRLYSPTGAARLLVYPIDSSGGESGPTLGPNVLYDFQIYRSYLINGQATRAIVTQYDSISLIGTGTGWRIT
jgi:hypothetical protein